MKAKNNARGFTLAELLIVVAILGILSGVAFVAVQNYQHSTAQLERDAIAKEIFVAAQNHLTLAQGQGYPGVGKDKFGTPVTGESSTADNTDIAAGKQGIYYYVVPTDAFTPAGGTALDMMLPFGAFDETVRLEGSYIIRYQKDPGIVLDVFYCPPPKGDIRFARELTAADYEELMNNFRDTVDDTGKTTSKKDARRNYNGAVVGWYGNGVPLETGDTLNPPVVEVENAERLIVRVKNTNFDPATLGVKGRLTLIVEGVQSKQKMAFMLVGEDGKLPHERVTQSDGVFTVCLDDVTEVGTYDFRFSKLNEYDTSDKKITKTGDLIPGENIVVYAVAYDNDVLSNIGYSNEVTTNSLFADLIDPAEEAADVAGASGEEGDGDGGDDADGGDGGGDGGDGGATPGEPDNRIKVLVSNIRHLENLDKAISAFAQGSVAGKLNVQRAEQTEDLDWDQFKTALGKETGLYILYDDTSKAAEDSFKPVDLDYALDYDGGSHKIENVDIWHDDDAGIFGNVSATGDSEGVSAISNLELVNVNVNVCGTGTDKNAGALAGSLTGARVTNVIAREGNPLVSADETAGTFPLRYAAGEATDKAAGDLKPGDPVPGRIASKGGSAGGLIGKMSGGAVDRCAAALTVEGKDAAGGLIGKIVTNGTEDYGAVTASYAGGHTDLGEYYAHDEDGKRKTDGEIWNVTATDGSAGGLVGVAGSAAIQNCYATCSATGETAGGFAGSVIVRTESGKATVAGCYATGLVKGTGKETVEGVEVPKEGAFAGVLDKASPEAAVVFPTNCAYFEIINERKDADGVITYLAPTPRWTETDTGIAPFDEYAADPADQTFYVKAGPTGADDVKWQSAAPYDETLKTYYHDDASAPLYNLETVKQLQGEGSAVAETDFVARHYGDWPAPETMVVNVKEED